MKSVLTIAGSDSSGGAGIQADIKTIAAHHLFAQSVITALTAQNTEGVYGVFNVPESFVAQQIDVVFNDIRPNAVKIGMVSSAEIVETIAAALVRNSAENIVVDPVMIATSGSNLASDEAVIALQERLMPLAKVITPNITEASVLADFSISTPKDQEHAALTIAHALQVNVLVKGGHGMHDANDVLAFSPKSDFVFLKDEASLGNEASLGDEATKQKPLWFKSERIDNPNTHGTGCTLSSAIACGLAKGVSVEESIREAKCYLNGALAAKLNLGHGSGPLDHMWQLQTTL